MTDEELAAIVKRNDETSRWWWSVIGCAPPPECLDVDALVEHVRVLREWLEQAERRKATLAWIKATLEQVQDGIGHVTWCDSLTGYSLTCDCGADRLIWLLQSVLEKIDEAMAGV